MIWSIGFSRNYRDSDRGGRFDREDRDDRRGGGGFRRYDDERNGGLSRREDTESRREDTSESCKLQFALVLNKTFIIIPCIAEPRQRPKLNLAPRTKPIEASKPEPAVPSASIFGNAKPVDTAERERQIEEKLRKEQEERLKESSGRDGGRESRDQSADRESVSKGLFFSTFKLLKMMIQSLNIEISDTSSEIALVIS